MKQFTQVRGTQPSQPPELEIGKTTVYVRSNITAIDEEDFVGWEYDEIQYTKDEYIQHLASRDQVDELKKENALLKAQNQANADRADFHEEILTEIILAIAP